MYMTLTPNIIKNRRQLKAAQREFKDILDRQRFTNPDYTNWQVAREHAKTVQRLQSNPYRRKLGLVTEDDSEGSNLWIRHHYRHVLRRLDQDKPAGSVTSTGMSSEIAERVASTAAATVPHSQKGFFAGVRPGDDPIDGEHLLHLGDILPDKNRLVIQRGKHRVNTDALDADIHYATYGKKDAESVRPPATPTVLLGEIDKTTRLPNGTTYRGEPNVMVPLVGTVKDPNVLPPGLPYPTPQKLIHPEAAKAVEAQESRVGKIKVNGKYTRVVQRVESSGIVNLYRVNDDGSKEPLTGIIG